nr:MAG TPA: hypothetical protein [Caudoviricetes sp.]
MECNLYLSPKNINFTHTYLFQKNIEKNMTRWAMGAD